MADLFDLERVRLRRQRAKKMVSDHGFLFSHVEAELGERLRDLGYSSKKIQNLSLLEGPPLSEPVEGILSCLYAHWINNLTQYFQEIRGSLKPGGIFLGAMWGGQTLHELRDCLVEAELSLRGGASPRVIPMVRPVDAPLLLSQAGFLKPVIDVETLSVTYPSLVGLMRDLRGMGENNSLRDREKTFTPRSLFQKTEDIYRKKFVTDEGKLIATFEVLYLTGWAP